MAVVLDGNNLTTTGVINSATAKNSTSGTSIDFTGIPVGTQRITIMFNGVSSSGANVILIQLGISGGYVTSGYTGSSSRFAAASLAASNWGGTGIDISQTGAAASAMSGHVVATNISGSTWVISGVLSRNGSDFNNITAGIVTLSGTLTSVRVITTSTDTFDAGSVNILYE
jgi:hypothetical protein